MDMRRNAVSRRSIYFTIKFVLTPRRIHWNVNLELGGIRAAGGSTSGTAWLECDRVTERDGA